MMKYYDRSPPGWRGSVTPNAPKLIRIDIDPEEMVRLKPDVGIVADSIDGVTALINRVNKIGFQKGNLDRIASMKAKMRKAIEKIQPQMSYLDIIRDVLPPPELGFRAPEKNKQKTFSGVHPQAKD